MKYRYATSLPNSDPNKVRNVALIKVTLRYKENQVAVLSMIDSGADINVFNTDYADLLGIDAADCEAVTVAGVGGVPYDCFKTEIELEPDGLSAITVPALFIASTGVDGLLGQEGFFDHHIITFNAAQHEFEIVSI